MSLKSICYSFLLLNLISCQTNSSESKQDVIRSWSKLTKEFLCEQDSQYLRCANLSEEQCKSEISDVAIECEAEFKTIAFPSKVDQRRLVLQPYRRQYIDCVMQKHSEIGSFNMESADKCLNKELTEQEKKEMLSRELLRAEEMMEKIFGHNYLEQQIEYDMEGKIVK